MAFKETLTFEEVLKRFKEAYEAKANRGTKKKRYKSANQNNKCRNPLKKDHNC